MLMSDTQHAEPPFEPAVSIFMLVKTAREWPEFSPDQRFQLRPDSIGHLRCGSAQYRPAWRN
jgi:hypothetical protein